MLCASTSARPRLGDQLQHAPEVALGADRNHDVARRLEAMHRPLELLAPSLRDLVEPGVRDRGRRPSGQDPGSILVGFGEVSLGLLGETEIAPRFAADHDRDAEKAMHQRMAGGKAIAQRVLPHICQAQGSGLLYQHAEHATTARKLADRTAGGIIHPGRDETFELGSLFVEHAQRRVSGPGDVPGLLENQVEDLLRVKLGQ